jgi:hypothetical protein
VTEYHILNLGAGVQSTCLYLMSMAGEPPRDYAIFADTGEEPTTYLAILTPFEVKNGPGVIYKVRPDRL